MFEEHEAPSVWDGKLRAESFSSVRVGDRDHFLSTRHPSHDVTRLYYLPSPKVTRLRSASEFYVRATEWLGYILDSASLSNLIARATEPIANFGWQFREPKYRIGPESELV
jgi:hypothetical protein